jgi:hypothetical protein
MYVPGMVEGRGAEIGQPHFQHPGRTERDFGPTMDRFSEIVLDLTLSALSARPNLLAKYRQGENILLLKSDFEHPQSSPCLYDMRTAVESSGAIDYFDQICRNSIREVPSLSDFLAEKRPIVVLPRHVDAAPPTFITKDVVAEQDLLYVSQFPVVSGQDYVSCIRHVGSQVELVGKIVLVKSANGLLLFRFGTAYHRTPCFVMSVAAYGRAGLAQSHFQGRFVSVRGVLKSHTTGRRNKYQTVQVSVTDYAEIQTLTEEEYEWRLGRRKRKQTIRKTIQVTSNGPRASSSPSWTGISVNQEVAKRLGLTANPIAPYSPPLAPLASPTARMPQQMPSNDPRHRAPSNIIDNNQKIANALKLGHQPAPSASPLASPTRPSTAGASSPWSSRSPPSPGQSSAPVASASPWKALWQRIARSVGFG